jgi:hypothetical protein
MKANAKSIKQQANYFLHPVQTKKRMVAAGTPGEGLILLHFSSFQKDFDTIKFHHINLRYWIAEEV